jgi:hypothetical protein
MFITIEKLESRQADIRTDNIRQGFLERLKARITESLKKALF